MSYGWALIDPLHRMLARNKVGVNGQCKNRPFLLSPFASALYSGDDNDFGRINGVSRQRSCDDPKASTTSCSECKSGLKTQRQATMLARKDQSSIMRSKRIGLAVTQLATDT